MRVALLVRSMKKRREEEVKKRERICEAILLFG
jgi:hypothetical protein